jgi:hypothetical protein
MATRKVMRYGAIRPDGSIAIPLEHELLGSPSGGRVAFLRGGRWGFLDLEGKEVVAPEYDFVWPFAGDAAAVERGGSWRSIGMDGREVEGFRGAWSDGRAAFTVGKTPTRDDRTVHHGLSGYVDTEGKVIVEAKHARADPYRNGYAVVGATMGATEVIDRDGRTVVGPVEFSWGVGGGVGPDGWCLLRPGGVTTFYGTDGAVKLATELMEVEEFAEEVAPFRTNREDPRAQRHLWGYLARDGSVSIAPTFWQARPFQDGVAQVFAGFAKWGVIDRSGDFVIDLIASHMHPIQQGAMPAAVIDRAHPLWGVLGVDGAWRHDPAFAVVTPFRDGVAVFRRLDNTTGLIDTSGRVVMEGFAGAKAGAAWPLPFTRKGKRQDNGQISGAAWGLFAADGTEAVACAYAEIGPPVEGVYVVGNKV